jgi:ribosomal protein L16/L10AE
MGSWSLPQLTPAQLEARRLEAARLFQARKLTRVSSA